MKRSIALLALLAPATIAIDLSLGACTSDTPVNPPPDASAPDVTSDAPNDAPVLPAAWRPVLEGLEGALLSVWGTSEKDIWTVGGSLGNGGDAYVLRFDGNVWKRVRPGGTETFWWVHGTSANDVWLVGEKGRITHWDGTRFEEKTSGTTATLFGVWAAAPNDAWAVGGIPDDASAPNDVVLHWDGTSWKTDDLPEKKKAALFKVWGSSANDVYVVGEQGLVWHRTSGAWKREADGVAKGRLTTVTGCSGSELFAVGGRDLLTRDATGNWTRSSTPFLNDLNGVACAPVGAPARDYGRAVIVGGGSLKLRLVGNEWKDDFGSEPFTDLHGAWVDPTGAFWGVGGAYLASAKPGASRAGVVARYGPGTVPNALEK